MRDEVYDVSGALNESFLDTHHDFDSDESSGSEYESDE